MALAQKWFRCHTSAMPNRIHKSYWCDLARLHYCRGVIKIILHFKICAKGISVNVEFAQCWPIVIPNCNQVLHGRSMISELGLKLAHLCTHPLTDSKTHWHRLIGSFTHPLTYWLTDWLIEQLSNQMTGSVIDCPSKCLNDCVTD